MGSWTDKRKAEAQRLWTEGLSASEVAAALGRPRVSRNAVIGLLHRMKGPQKPRGPRPARSVSSPLRTVKKFSVSPSVVAMRKARKAKVDAPPILEALPPPLPEPSGLTSVTLLGLPFTGACKYPVGKATGAAQLFCGSESGDRVYCPFHRNVAYQPLIPSKRREPVSTYHKFGEAA